MTYTPDPDRPPRPRGLLLGLALLMAGAALVVAVLPLILTALGAALAGA